MTNVENRLNDYKEKTKIDGEELVRNVFPKRVFEMEEVLSSELFALDPKQVYSEINIPYPPYLPVRTKGPYSVGDVNCVAEPQAPQPDVASMTVDKPSEAENRLSRTVPVPYGSVSYNRQIKAMIEKTKPCLTQLMMEAQLVRLWVQYNIPRIEDGNNFGVGIQEEVLSEASSIERDACTFLDQITRYFASRGKLIGKVAKFPHIDDYRECIRDMDEKQAITMRYIIMEIRNHYATLHDIILKNIDRIKMPRSNNAVTMY
ncbi:proteasome activator subunit 3 [Clonorchis sinensis]|uniref:Proteasome activator subunit 3 n=1 Tax=Clonorchis sinensis TaxID=79923 RepID=G7YMU7_CLOSI|nr:proteasome activator subunit 3 [Clonorchis sinensis]